MLKASLMFALVAGVAVPATAQPTSGVIRGVVTDSLGGVVPNATVDLDCRGVRHRTTSSPTGEFSATGLPDGRCRVTARAESFEPHTVNLDARSGSSATLVLRVRTFASEVVVTPARGREQTAFDLPDTTSVTTRQDIETRPYTLFAQVLREEPGILVQQTTSGQASPIIRGFTGQSNVYLLDGVRLNNSSWRSGPNQYFSWVEGGPVGRVEIVRGGGSVQYGSDALGGTIQLLSESVISGVAPSRINGSLDLFGGTADKSVGVQGDLGFNLRKAMFRLGGTRRTVDDLRGGGGIDSHSALTRFLGLPSTVVGDRMPGTSFDMGGGYGVVDVTAGNGGLIHGLYMHNDQSGSSRYDRILGGNGVYRSGFEPQTLDFGVVRYQKERVAGLDGVSGSASYNRQADGRFEQARPTATLDTQKATTTALGLQLQGHRLLSGRHDLIVGTEYYTEDIDASRQLIANNGTVQRQRPDIPNGTSYTNLGVFAQQSLALVPDRLSVRAGLRYGSFGFKTTADPVLGVPLEDVTTRSVTFQTGGVFKLTENINIIGNVSRGFRAPNSADLGSIGLSGGGGFEITPSRAAELNALVGSTGAADAVSTGDRVAALKPEVVYQYEGGVRVRAGRFAVSTSVFDMELYDFMQRRALIFDSNITGTTISGFRVVRQDPSGAAYIAEDIRPIATRVNVDRGRITGFDSEGEVRLTQAWKASAYYSMANGKVLPSGEFARRISPPMGGAKLRWTGSRLWLEGVVTFAAEQTRINAADLTDARIGGARTRASIATFFNGTAVDMGLVQNGVLLQTGETLTQVQNRVMGSATTLPLFTTQPGYAVYGLRGGLQLHPQFGITLIAENLADTNYRLYGSGVDSPGFNLQVRTNYRF